MPTFVEITPDPFAEQFRKETQGDHLEEGSRAGSVRGPARSFSHVRRPVRGIQIKDDTYATLQCRTADGRSIPLIDAGGEEAEDQPGIGYSEKYSNFLIQSMQEERREKTQIVQTFGEPFIFFFGEHPRVVQGQGVLLNTEDFNWRAEFWENYNRYLRGTKCVQNKTRITLSWDDIVIEGYFLQAAAQESAQEPGYVNFSFQVFLTNYQNVSTIGATDFPSGSFEGNVKPDELVVPGSGVLPPASQTSTVRQLNISDPALQTKNSLFQSLRDGISGVATVEGRLEALTNLTDQFIDHNKKVVVPRGFAGGSVFDVDTQIALASVSPASQTILVQQALGERTIVLRGRPGTLTVPVTFGKFRDAIDEYIAKFPSTGGDPARPLKLVENQEADILGIENKVREVFERAGVNIDPPLEATLLAQKIQFGAVQVRVGSVTEAVGIPALASVESSLAI